MSNGLSIADAVALVSDPRGAIGFPSNESRDFDSTNNVVAFDKGARISRIADAAQELVETERPNRKGRRAKVRDDGRSRLNISEAAQLLVQQEPKKIQGRLTRSQGVDMLLGNKPAPASAGRITSHQDAAQLLLSAESGENPSSAQFEAPSRVYGIEAVNAVIALENANAALMQNERQLAHFVNNFMAAFPDVAGNPDAVMRLDIHRFGQWLAAQDRAEILGRQTEQLVAMRQQAVNNAIEIEHREFLAQHPDFTEDDARAMANLVRAFVGDEEAFALATTVMGVNSNDPRVFQILQLAAGSDDAEAVIGVLRESGFSEGDIRAIGAGNASAHLLDHRIRGVLLRAARNVDFEEAAA